jgi:hypothetical protein
VSPEERRGQLERDCAELYVQAEELWQLAKALGKPCRTHRDTLREVVRTLTPYSPPTPPGP